MGGEAGEGQRRELQGTAYLWDFSGGPVVKILCCHCEGHGFDLWLGLIPGWGTNILQAPRSSQKFKK